VVNRLSLVFAACLALPFAAACDPFAQRAADVDNPQTFGEGDLTFEYPGNWKVETNRETVESFTIVTHNLEPRWGNSIAIVQVFTPGVSIEFDQLLSDFRTGMKESLAGALLEDRQVNGQDSITVEHDLMGSTREGRRMRFAISVLGETTESTVDVYVAELDDRTIIVYTQAPDGDLPQAKPGFEQVMNTLELTSD